MFQSVKLVFFNDTATTEIYTLSLHDALPISRRDGPKVRLGDGWKGRLAVASGGGVGREHEVSQNEGNAERSEEHTSELQSRQYLVCRLLVEKKNNETLASKETCFKCIVTNKP